MYSNNSISYFFCLLLLCQMTFSFHLTRLGKRINSISTSKDTNAWSKGNSDEEEHILKTKNKSENVLFLKNEEPFMSFVSINTTLKPLDSSEDLEESNFELEFSSDLPVSHDYTEPFHNEFEKDLKIEISDIEPVYVKPPKGFKPILYPNRQMDGVSFATQVQENGPTLPLPSKPIPYKYPNGVSSWILGGIRGLERGGFWESLASDSSLSREEKKPTSSGILEILLPEKVFNSDNTEIQVISSYKPPLPPPHSSYQPVHPKVPSGLSSWLFGGFKDLSSSHWRLPSITVEKIEMVPLNDSSFFLSSIKSKQDSMSNIESTVNNAP